MMDRRAAGLPGGLLALSTHRGSLEARKAVGMPAGLGRTEVGNVLHSSWQLESQYTGLWRDILGGLTRKMPGSAMTSLHRKAMKEKCIALLLAVGVTVHWTLA